MPERRPSGRGGAACAVSALVLALPPAPGAAATLASSLSVQVEVVERCSATVAGGRLQLVDCPETLATIASPPAAEAELDAGSGLAEREVIGDAEIRYLTVIY